MQKKIFREVTGFGNLHKGICEWDVKGKVLREFLGLAPSLKAFFAVLKLMRYGHLPHSSFLLECQAEVTPLHYPPSPPGRPSALFVFT